MTNDDQKLRLDGIYRQNEQGQFMLRVKIPAGVLSCEQVRKLAEIADRHAGGRVHLTTRGSVEFHDLDRASLPEVTRGIAAVGLTSRGACGGTVRGISCSSTFGGNFPTAQALARTLHRHFAGNPYFEGLPKKFKIGVDGDYTGSRHLIQDVGLVYVGDKGDEASYDVWTAGGLGREPQAAYRFESEVEESRLIPLLEAIIRVYRDGSEKGKRLKHLVNRIGEAEFREQVESQKNRDAIPRVDNGLDRSLLPCFTHETAPPVTIPVFAGELPSQRLQYLAELASRHAEGVLAVTADQDIALFPRDKANSEQLRLELAACEEPNDASVAHVRFRICPGNHECRMGLAPTRDVARQVIAVLSRVEQEKTWAIAGCPNSCSQPQLADHGIIARKMVRDEHGSRSIRFDLTRRSGEMLGESIAGELTLEQLLERIENL